MPPTLLFRNATALNHDGSIKENAFRQFLQHFVDAKLGVCLASAGSGEGGAVRSPLLPDVPIYREISALKGFEGSANWYGVVARARLATHFAGAKLCCGERIARAIRATHEWRCGEMGSAGEGMAAVKANT